MQEEVDEVALVDSERGSQVGQGACVQLGNLCTSKDFGSARSCKYDGRRLMESMESMELMELMENDVDGKWKMAEMMMFVDTKNLHFRERGDFVRHLRRRFVFLLPGVPPAVAISASLPFSSSSSEGTKIGLRVIGVAVLPLFLGFLGRGESLS